MYGFRIEAPAFGPRLKLIGHLRDGRRISVNETLMTRESSMALCRGYLVPPGDGLEGAQRIIAKFSLYPPEDRFLIKERHLLSKLSNVQGIPEMIARGKAKVRYLGRNSRGRICETQRESPFFVMPELPGEDLDRFAVKGWDKTVPERKDVALLATRAFPALAEVLAELHENNVVHRDVKPNNVLFHGEGDLKLLDFGRANWINAKPRADHGTYVFFPPEFLLEKTEREDVRYDVYSLGVTCFVTLTGKGAVLFGRMEDPSLYSGIDLMFAGVERVVRRYYNALAARRSLSDSELMVQSNMPSELKQTALGKYLLKLFHPAKESRPSDMRRIARELKRLGGQLLEHEIWSSGPAA